MLREQSILGLAAASAPAGKIMGRPGATAQAGGG